MSLREVTAGEPTVVPADQERIQTPCPACGSRSLFVGDGGWLTCGYLGCPAPGLADDLLEVHWEKRRMLADTRATVARLEAEIATHVRS